MGSKPIFTITLLDLAPHICTYPTSMKQAAQGVAVNNANSWSADRKLSAFCKHSCGLNFTWKNICGEHLSMGNSTNMASQLLSPPLQQIKKPDKVVAKKLCSISPFTKCKTAIQLLGIMMVPALYYSITPSWAQLWHYVVAPAVNRLLSCYQTLQLCAY